LTIRDRHLKGEHAMMTLEEFVKKVSIQLQDKPYLPLNLPKRLSNRPQIR
jgi:hypothetical protein